MMEYETDKLKYPIGKFNPPYKINDQIITAWIAVIQSFPSDLKNEVAELSKDELQKTYRSGGWSIRQIIHHCADSHMNSLIRFKLALTEDKPLIKPYAENLWAELSDSKDYPIESSLKILEGIHSRWSALMKNMSQTDLEKQFRHPESNELISIKTNIGIYAWHCEHHLTHIKIAKSN